jgi:deoxyribodipyrimidine photo-lyase
VPEETPLSRLPRIAPSVLPRAIVKRWPRASARLLSVDAPGDPSAFPIDYAVPAVPTRGGARAAGRALRRFIQTKLGGYGEQHNHPDDEGTSRLSPYLHFGHVSAHDVFTAVMTRERWTTRKLAARGGGAREGWWGVSPSAEAFLDQLVVWRELAFNGCEYLDDVIGYESVPDWARRTLESHLDDPRPHTYSMTQLENARTSDEVWNAAQRQLVSEGWMHGYLRMLWGKKILEWSEHPSEALIRMRLIMDRHALDGRDPNSYAGYAWVLGRYDRPWPERPVFGTVRCMTSASALRKLRMRHYLETYSAR